jgi:hypothetical protein
MATVLDRAANVAVIVIAISAIFVTIGHFPVIERTG